VNLPPPLANITSAADVAKLLERTESRLTAREIFDQLAAEQKLHGWSTLKQTLALMVRLGFIDVRHRKPYGYQLVTSARRRRPFEQARANIAQAVTHVTTARTTRRATDRLHNSIEALGFLTAAVTDLADACETLGIPV